MHLCGIRDAAEQHEGHWYHRYQWPDVTHLRLWWPPLRMTTFHLICYCLFQCASVGLSRKNGRRWFVHMLQCHFCFVRGKLHCQQKVGCSLESRYPSLRWCIVLHEVVLLFINCAMFYM